MKLTKKYIGLMIDTYYAKKDSSFIRSSNNKFIDNLKEFYKTLAEMPDEYELTYKNLYIILNKIRYCSETQSDDSAELKQKLIKDLQLDLAERCKIEVSALDKFFSDPKEAAYLFESIQKLEQTNLIDVEKKNLKKLVSSFDHNLAVCNALFLFSENNMLNQTKFDFVCENAATIKSFCQGYNLLAQIIQRLSDIGPTDTLHYASKGISLNKLVDNLKPIETLLWKNPAHTDKLAAACIALTLCQLRPDLEKKFYTAFIKHPEISHLLALSLRIIYSYLEDKLLPERLGQLLNNLQFIPIITHTLFNLELEICELRGVTREEVTSCVTRKLDEIFANPNALFQHMDNSSNGLIAKHKQVIDDIMDLEKLPFFDTTLFIGFKKMYIADMQSMFEAKRIFRILVTLSKNLANSGEKLLSILPIELLEKIALKDYQDHISYQALANNLHSLYEHNIEGKAASVPPKVQTNFFSVKDKETVAVVENKQVEPEEASNQQQAVVTSLRK